MSKAGSRRRKALKEGSLRIQDCRTVQATRSIRDRHTLGSPAGPIHCLHPHCHFHCLHASPLSWTGCHFTSTSGICHSWWAAEWMTEIMWAPSHSVGPLSTPGMGAGKSIAREQQKLLYLSLFIYALSLSAPTPQKTSCHKKILSHLIFF